MRQGHITLANGLTVVCSYELDGEADGRVALLPSIAKALVAGDTATLAHDDGTRSGIAILRSEDDGRLRFRVADP